MGNNESSKNKDNSLLNKDSFNGSFIQYFNIFTISKLKLGMVVPIPIRIKNLSSDDFEKLKDEINSLIFQEDKLYNLNIVCTRISEKQTGNIKYLANFIIPKYHKERNNTLLDFRTGNKLLSKNDEDRILNYERRACDRIWRDLDENVQILKRRIYQKLNNLLLSDENIIDHVIEIHLEKYDKVSSLIRLMELFPYLKDTVIDDLNTNSNVEFYNMNIQLGSYEVENIISIEWRESLLEPLLRVEEPSAPNFQIL